MKDSRPIYTTRELRPKVKRLEVYKVLSRTIQKNVIRRTNLMHIHKAIQDIERIGFDAWYNSTKYQVHNIKIIQQLINSNTNDSTRKNRLAQSH